MSEYKTTRQAVMGLLTELAKHAEPGQARLYKQAKDCHTLAAKVSIFNIDRTRKNPAGFKRGANRDLWLAQRPAA